MGEKYETFRGLTEEYKFVLPDSCAWISRRYRNHNIRLVDCINRDNLEKVSGMVNDKKSFFENILYSLESDGVVHFSEGVFRELSDSSDIHFDYKRIRELNRERFVKIQLWGDYLGLLRNIRSTYREARKIVRKFKEAGKVICLTEQENKIYQYLGKRYSNFKKGDSGLSEADFQLLLDGAVISLKRGPTAIISNDFGILRAWKYLCIRENLDSTKYTFYIRIDNDSYIVGDKF